MYSQAKMLTFEYNIITGLCQIGDLARFYVAWLGVFKKMRAVFFVFLHIAVHFSCWQQMAGWNSVVCSFPIILNMHTFSQPCLFELIIYSVIRLLDWAALKWMLWLTGYFQLITHVHYLCWLWMLATATDKTHIFGRWSYFHFEYVAFVLFTATWCCRSGSNPNWVWNVFFFYASYLSRFSP